jgi:CubicO group peptidase (beta-lactamase class C family)
VLAVALAVLVTLVHASWSGRPARAEVRMADRVESVMRDYLEEYGVPGAAVAVTRGADVVYAGGIGEDSNGDPVTSSTRMRIASLSKSFTALAVVQLAEQGLLGLDDPVVEHLPEFDPDDPRADQITVRQLLNHSSGLADSASPDEYETGPRTLEQAVDRLDTAALVADSGTEWNYHNPNYHVAARLVVVASGADFADYLERHVFTPAGMSRTATTATTGDDVAGLAQGHTYAFGQPIAVDGPDYFTAGAGGVVSTARDMARWLVLNANDGRTATGNRVVSESGMEQLHTAQEPDPDGTYALGWFHTPAADGRPEYISHSGGAATYSAYQVIYPGPGEDYGIAVLMNSGASLTGPTPTDPAQDIAAALGLDEPAPSEPSRALWVDLAFSVLALVAMGLGVLGVRRAGRWVRRRKGHRWVTAMSLLPHLALLGFVVSIPRLQLALLQRDAPWSVLFHVAPVIVCAMFVLAGSSLVVLLTRAWRWQGAGKVAG